MSKKTRRTISKQRIESILPYDPWVVGAAFCLLAIGFLMVASASIVVAERLFPDPFHYVTHQGIFLVAGLIIAAIILRIHTDYWESASGMLLLISLALLTVVLIPGIGHRVNGSMRWIGLGPVGMQVSEFAKLCVIVYIAGYMVRHNQEMRTQISGFIKPLGLLGLVSALLLLEPDFGAMVVIMATALGMLFLGGVRIWQFAVLLILVIGAFGLLAVSAPYRMQRLTSFLDPWANQFDSGYQLTQALIAFGRGSCVGVGLGDSVLKQFYLPEAHTDFLFAVLAEELGLLGVLVIIGLFVILVGRALWIGRQAQLQGKLFSAFLAYGLGLWIGLQAMINIGVNSGVLPTKGLTLPLMSYGGSSMLIMCVAVALLLRVDYELRMARLGINIDPELRR